VTQPHVDVIGAVTRRRPGDELIDLVDLAADEIGDAAGRVAGVPAPFERHDLEVGAVQAGRRNGRHPTRVGPDHDEARHNATTMVTAPR
jgi:hypothetical protein